MATKRVSTLLQRKSIILNRGKRFSSASLTADPIREASHVLSWDSHTPVKLRTTQSYPGDLPPLLVQSLMKRSVEKHCNEKALVIKRNGEWQTWRYDQYYEDVHTVARGFLALGLDRFGGVGIMSHNCPEWFLSSVGSIFAGGLSCGIYATNSPDLVSYISGHAPLNLLVIENLRLLDRILAGRRPQEAFPTIKKIVVIEGESDGRADVITWKQLMEIGKQESDHLLTERYKDQAVNDAAMMIYTSGTTGPPKGAMISHDNITWTSIVSMRSHGWEGGDKNELMSYLPLSHVASQLIDCYMLMHIGGTTYFADKEALKGTLVDNLKEIRPRQFVGVPRVYEKIQERLQEVASKNSALKRGIGNWAKRVATDHHEAMRAGSITKPRLQYNKIHEALGLERCFTTPNGGCFSTAAPLSIETFKYFQSLDMPIAVFYGSTETSGPISGEFEGVAKLRVGSVGKRYLGIDSKISEPDENGIGEIVTNGRNIFMGYQKDEAKTRASFTPDFYFQSGDTGSFDEDGYLFLGARIKELIITAGGENVAPVPIENKVKERLKDLLSYAIVAGEQRKHLAALLTLRVLVDQDTLMPTNVLEEAAVSWAKRLGVQVKTVDDFISGPDAEKLRNAIASAISEVNSEAPSNPQKVQKFIILARDFSLGGGELGPTLKIKRYVIYDKYKQAIDEMYKTGHNVQ